MLSKIWIVMTKFVWIIAGCLSLTTAHAVRYAVEDAYNSLPNYDKEPVFTNIDKRQHERLENAIANITPSIKECRAGSVLVWKAPKYPGDTSGQDWRKDLTTNICDPKKLDSIRKLIGNLAPSLNLSNMTVWLTNLDDANKSDLIVGYIDISKGDIKYPYLSLWRLKLENGVYRAIYAGPFLDGTLYAIRNFGDNLKHKAVFIKYVSCIECEPWVYLIAIDFDTDKDAHPYEFTYDVNKHEEFDPSIEYELPGMGHSVDAKVETRVLPASLEGPHLLQFYKMEEGEDPNESWAFTCKNYKCDFQLYKGKMPSKFEKLWSKATPLK
jgi:hypothetical protein